MHQISTNVCPAEKHTKHSTDVTLPSSNLVNLTCIFLSARARYFVSKPNFWPCTRSRSWHLNTRSTSQACWKQGGRGGGTYAPQALLLALPDFWPPHYNSPPQIFRPWDMPAFYSTQVFFTLLLWLAAFQVMVTSNVHLPTAYQVQCRDYTNLEF